MGVYLPPEVEERMLVARLVVELGWSFEYVQSLTIEQIGDILSYESAKVMFENGEY